MVKTNTLGITDAFDFNVKSLQKKILKKTVKTLNIKTKHIVSYIYTDLSEIHRINREYRKIDRPTDVISFAYIDETEDRTLPYELGDVFICVDKVKEQALSYGHSIYRECAFLITHGILHLLGYDHLTESDEALMFSLQDKILNELKILR